MYAEGRLKAAVYLHISSVESANNVVHFHLVWLHLHLLLGGECTVLEHIVDSQYASWVFAFTGRGNACAVLEYISVQRG